MLVHEHKYGDSAVIEKLENRFKAVYYETADFNEDLDHTGLVYGYFDIDHVARELGSHGKFVFLEKRR